MNLPLYSVFFVLFAGLATTVPTFANDGLQRSLDTQIQIVLQDSKAMRAEMNSLRERIESNSSEIQKLSGKVRDDRQEFRDHERSLNERIAENGKDKNPLTHNFNGMVTAIGGSGKSIGLFFRNIFSNGKNRDAIASLERQVQESQKRYNWLEISARAGDSSVDLMRDLLQLSPAERNSKIARTLSQSAVGYEAQVFQYHLQQVTRRVKASSKSVEPKRVDPPAARDRDKNENDDRDKSATPGKKSDEELSEYDDPYA